MDKPVSDNIFSIFVCFAKTLLLSCVFIFILRPIYAQQVSLDKRYPDAGVWVAYPGSTDLSPTYIKGAMAYTKWKDIMTSNTNYNWTILDQELNRIINTAGKKAFTDLPAGYCPSLDWPQFLKDHIAHHKLDNGDGCNALQFWDPLYKQYYSDYIKALAKHLAESDSRDIRPNQTDISLVRAMTMAKTMENLPGDDEINKGDWKASQFTAAPDGHIYNTDLTLALKDEYWKWVGNEYKNAINAEYQKVGLPPPAVAPKSTGYWSPEPVEDYFAQQGLWLWKTSGMEMPDGWYHSFVENVKTGKARAHTESGQHPRPPNIAQSTYWELMAALHSGVEIIGIYGSNRLEPTIQPNGPINFAENYEGLIFADKYAGYEREPANSPGAWIALRGWYPENRFSTLEHETIWSNYGMLLTQYRPQDSIALFGVDDRASPRRKMPVVQRNTQQPWNDKQSACLSQYSASQCDYIIQQPTRYLGIASNGKYSYSFPTADLGKILYCGEDMFCTNQAQTTLTETMIWARQTNKTAGNNYMRFDLNDQFAATLNGKAKIRVVYLDRGSGSWQLQYDNGISAGTINKQNSNIWKEVSFTVANGSFANGGTGGTDLALFNGNDDDDIFHMVEVTPITGTACPKKSQGDANCDGSTNLSDFEQWRKEYMNIISTKTADFNISGAVDLADFELWRKIYLPY